MTASIIGIVHVFRYIRLTGLPWPTQGGSGASFKRKKKKSKKKRRRRGQDEVDQGEEGVVEELDDEDAICAENLVISIVACLARADYKLQISIQMDRATTVFFFIKDQGSKDVRCALIERGRAGRRFPKTK